MMLMVLPFQAMANKADQAYIITQEQRPSQCISRVAITDIDGRLRMVPKQGFLLDVGTHSLKGRALVSTAGCPVVNSKKAHIVPPLEADFEAGKTYFVGMDHSSTNQADWRIVIWKVE